ncbi:MAG TPA: hypothetical protein DEG28_12775 [Porphyromonadaceae bacterium]|nr:hypothetical protein [Porphyromonadaceae bacterium]HBX21797.1 hypothetical protein [Porphyromonadaceae bacterium]HBX46740.1 hypothetical protein [Porphyromonadaceae bacterium]HCM19786.1 hypothetical protein [Porphyromonadaceae bacterium]
MRKIFNFVLFLLSMFLLISCNNRQDKEIYNRLSRWDKAVDSIPEQISDSLQTLDPQTLSRANRAYRRLLVTIAEDKTYVDFTSDSLIQKVANYYEKHDPKSENYIRSLIYLGIVRNRMGVNDSTAYEPLKKADRLFQKQPNPNPTIGYMINYFLGSIHYNNANFELANNYYNETLDFARLEKEPTHIFDAFLVLFWNEMIQKNQEKSKQYMDSLVTFYSILPEKEYFILNVQSAYYDTQGEYERALDFEKKKLNLSLFLKEKIDFSRVYFNISDRYNNIGQLDSAMYYAQKAIDMVKDSTYRHNYIFYENVAYIAEKQGNFGLANNYLKKASEIYKESVKKRLDTQVMELEKKYDLSEAENRALRSRQTMLSTVVLSLLLLMVLILVMMINRRHRRKAKMRLMVSEHENQKQTLQTQLLTEEANKRKWLMALYGHISERLTSLQEQFDQLSQRYVSSQPKIYESMRTLLRSTETELRDLPEELLPDAETFFQYTGIQDADSHLNETDKLLLMLVACHADNRQIATFMNASLQSIRTRKSQLKKKMTEKGMDISIFSA